MRKIYSTFRVNNGLRVIVPESSLGVQVAEYNVELAVRLIGHWMGTSDVGRDGALVESITFVGSTPALAVT